MSPPPRLLYIINVDWYFRLHWLDRALAARAAGYEVHLATALTQADSATELARLGLQLHPIALSRSGLNPLQELRSLRQLRGLLRRLRPALVHSITVKPNLYGGLLTRASATPTLASVTGLGAVFASARWQHRLLTRVILAGYRRLSRVPQHFVVLENTDDRRLLLDAGAIEASRSAVIAGAGVDIRRYAWQPPTTHDPVIVLFAARLIEEKGLRQLVEAMRRLRLQHPSLLLWVAGIPDDQASHPIPAADLARWQAAGLLRHLGQCQDMAGLLARVDIVCLPTRYREGIPRILIEAGAVGRPVISTRVAGCGDLIEDGVNGLLVAPDDPAALAEAIASLARDPARRLAMGAAARRRVEAGFSNDQVIQAHLALYRRLLSEA